MATGDFNGDGKPDLAVTSIDGLTILIGKGDGTFQPANTMASPLTLSIASADFNGDHLDDLVGNTSSVIAVVLSNGDGTFGSPRIFAITANPVRLVAGDFNGDHLMDLAVAGYSGGAVSILMGNGDGTVQTHVDYATGSNTTGVTVGDLNNDGKLDLVTSSRGSVSALLGNGDGTFQSAIKQFSCTFPSTPFIADINEDSKPDVVNGCGSIQPHHYSTAQIRLGNGDGTFGPSIGFGSERAVEMTPPRFLRSSSCLFRAIGTLELLVGSRLRNVATAGTTGFGLTPHRAFDLQQRCRFR